MESATLALEISKLFISLLCALIFGATLAIGAPVNLPYSGRLVEENGKPIPGPIDLVIEFYGTDTGGENIGGPYVFSSVGLQDGVFQINMAVDANEFHQIFSSTSNPVWIQVTDTTNGSVYPRQMLAATPYALKVPTDGTTITFDDEGRLQVVPSKDGSKLTGVKATSVGGKSANEVASTVTEVENSTTSGASDALVKTNSSGEITSQGLILPDGDTHTLTLKANSDLTNSHTYTFPPQPIGGNYLTTDAGGNLSWGSLGGGGDMAASTYDTNANNVVDAAEFTGGLIPSSTAVDMGGNFGIGAATLTVDDASSFPTKGHLLIDDEVIAYSGTTATTFTGLTRGAFGSTDALHLDDAKVSYISYAEVVGGVPKVALGDGAVLLNQGGRLQFTDNDSNTTSIVAPADLTADITYTLPAAAQNGFVLSTNATGTLSWIDPANPSPLDQLSVDTTGSAGSVPLTIQGDPAQTANLSEWKKGANTTLIDENGNIGVGAANPSAKIEIESNSAATGATDGLLIDQTGSGDSAISFKTPGEQYVVGIDQSDSDKFKISDGADFGTDRFVIDNAGRVGLGTSTPDVTLDVRGALDLENVGETVQMRFNPASAVPRLGTKTNHPLDIMTNDTSRISILANGNVGIGTTAPSNPLHVEATTAGSEKLATFSTGDETVAKLTIENGSATDGAFVPKIIGIGEGALQGLIVQSQVTSDTGSSPALSFDALVVGSTPVATRPLFDFRNDGTSQMIIEASGNVGIGTTDPQTNLDVRDTIGSGGVISWTSGTAGYLGSSTSAVFGSSGTSYLASTARLGFSINQAGGVTSDPSSVAMLIDNSGNIGIGSSAPASVLDIPGNVTSHVRVYKNIASSSGNYPSTTGNGIELKGSSAQRFAMAVNNTGAFSLMAESTGKTIDFNSAGTMSLDRIGMKGYGALSSPSLTMDITSGDEVGFYVPGGSGSNNLGFITDRLERMRINGSGNVGIGSTNPADKLTVSGAGTTRISVHNTTEAIGEYADMSFGSGTVNSTDLLGHIRTEITDADPNPLKSKMGFFVNGGDLALNPMTIDDNGFVGIGTTDPTSELQVIGVLEVGKGDTSRGSLALRGDDTGSDDGGYISLSTAADHDTTYGYYHINVNQDDLFIGRAGGRGLSNQFSRQCRYRDNDPSGLLAYS
jgi:hypothetical protein